MLKSVNIYHTPK